MQQEYSVHGFLAYPKDLKGKEEFLKVMLLAMAEKIAPAEFQLEVFDSQVIVDRQSFWGLNPFSVNLQSFCVLGEARTEEAREHPIYIKPPPSFPFPGIVIADSKFEHKKLKSCEEGLDGLLMHFVYITDPKNRGDIEWVFSPEFSACGEGLVPNPRIKDLRIYRRDKGYTVVAATEDINQQDFLREFIELVKKHRYKDKPDNESVAMGSGSASAYFMGPLRRIIPQVRELADKLRFLPTPLKYLPSQSSYKF